MSQRTDDAFGVRPLALTSGDGAGIGPELAGLAWSRLQETGPVFALFGSVALQLSRCPDVPVAKIASPAQAGDVFTQALPIIPVECEAKAIHAGAPSSASASLALASLQAGTAQVTAGACSALVTNPIHKAGLYDLGFEFPGHTEWLAEQSGPGTQSVMMLAGPSLRTVPVTVHIPLGTVPAVLTQAAIQSVARITLTALERDFAIPNPNVVVTGLNPHAGEDGALGREDMDVIAPAVAALRSEGHEVHGPLPADTLFHERGRARFDAALCMYHDQALIPVKTLHFDEAVNVTLGLAFVRTSPDHGTAFDIAGRGVARPDSLMAAVRMAAQMAARRQSVDA